MNYEVRVASDGKVEAIIRDEVVGDDDLKALNELLAPDGFIVTQKIKEKVKALGDYTKDVLKPAEPVALAPLPVATPTPAPAQQAPKPAHPKCPKCGSNMYASNKAGVNYTVKSDKQAAFLTKQQKIEYTVGTVIRRCGNPEKNEKGFSKCGYVEKV